MNIRRKFTTIIGSTLTVVCMTVNCQAFSFFTPQEQQENACAWIQDDGYYYLSDISGDDIEPVKIAESDIAYNWPYIDDAGNITDEIMNFSRSFDGYKYLGFSEDQKYLYFYINLTEHLEVGTLCCIETKYLKGKSSQIEKHILEIDRSVYTDTDPVVQENGSIIYLKKEDEKRTLYCFNADRRILIAENVYYFGSPQDEKTVYYTKEVNTENTKTYILYGAEIGNPKSEKEIGKDVTFYNYSVATIGIPGRFVLKGHYVYFVEKAKRLCKASYKSEKEIIAGDNLYIWNWTDDYILYTKGESSYPVEDIFDCSQSAYSQKEIEQFLESVKNIYNDGEYLAGRLYLYDYDQVLLESENYNMLLKRDGEEVEKDDDISMVKMMSEGNPLVIFVDWKELFFNKISVDDVLSDPEFSLSDKKKEKEILDKVLGEYFYKVGKVPYKCEVCGENNKTFILGEVDINDVNRIDMAVFNNEQNIAFLFETGHLSIVSLDDNTENDIAETQLENIDDIISMGNQLLCEQNSMLYWYNGNSLEELGSIDEAYDSYYKGYANNTALLLTYYDGRKYGGDLWKIGDLEKQKLDENVTECWYLKSGEILYISEGKLILYSNGIRTRIADDVKVAWPLNEEKKPELYRSDW